MEPNSVLPVLVTGIVVVIVASVAAGLLLWWTTEPRIRLVVRRTWLLLTVISVSAVAIFWFSTAIIGVNHSALDRSLQKQQQGELHQRLEKGGH